jgi:hypothetical protein
MRLAGPAIDDYVAGIADLLERYGVVLTTPATGRPLEILEADDGSVSFELIGSLPDGRTPALSTVIVRERFQAMDLGMFERDGYGYELVDRERDHRRAFHLHDADWFERRYLVVVHEHCEHPIGDPACANYQGVPLRDGYAGVLALIDAWTSEPDCPELRCLD